MNTAGEFQSWLRFIDDRHFRGSWTYKGQQISDGIAEIENTEAQRKQGLCMNFVQFLSGLCVSVLQKFDSASVRFLAGHSIAGKFPDWF